MGTAVLVEDGVSNSGGGGSGGGCVGCDSALRDISTYRSFHTSKLHVISIFVMDRGPSSSLSISCSE